MNDDAARKTTNHEEKTSSVSSERKVQKSSKLSAEGIEDQKRTLEQVGRVYTLCCSDSSV